MKRIAKSVAKQTGSLAKSVAKQALKDVGEIPKQAVGIKDPSQSQSIKLPVFKPVDVKKEVGEFPGTAVKQITSTSPIVEAMQQSDGKTPEVSKEEEAKIAKEGLERVKRLEAEIDKYRQERAQSETPAQPQAKPVEEEKDKSLGEQILPTSKPTRGVAQQSLAERKQRKIESRLGKS